MNQSTLCVPKARELPEGFVYIDELIEDGTLKKIAEKYDMVELYEEAIK